jgi:phosphatidylserine/phosphatidylglycerophosphate/cardiolipin synthase-like enzyme
MAFIQTEESSSKPTRVARHQSLIKVGVNAWRLVSARRIAMLVDAADYYRYLEEAFATAQRSILIAGWDFNGEIALRPDRPGAERLGHYLRRLIDERLDLHIHILVWSNGPIYSARQMRVFPKEPWADHPRINLCYDRHHPWRGCHHQKIVCIDDKIAFSGGIDLTVHRWDTSDHFEIDSRRKDLNGTLYPAVHDVQLAVDGEAARSLADLLRARWLTCKGTRIAPVRVDGNRWPAGLKPDLRNVDVAIARTAPAAFGRKGSREIELLNETALKAARRSVYIETQYLTCRRIGRLIERRLREPDGPEIIIVVPQECHGGLERLFMGGNRDRLVRRLRRADIYGRLRVVYPVVVDSEGAHEAPVFVHSKVMIIDDRFARIGSSNLNNRSCGMDTECDLAIEAATPSERAAVARLRDRLLAEHLGMTPVEVQSRIHKQRSIVEVIDNYSRGNRRLKPIVLVADAGPEKPIPLTALFDPKKPVQPARYFGKCLQILRVWLSRR